jgi:alkylation response protein AidB-like acyl-CoA dehydrogenase
MAEAAAREFRVTRSSTGTAPRSLRAHIRGLAGPGGPFSDEVSLALDEQAAFPVDAIEALNDWGLHRYYVPRQHGGALDDIATTMSLARLVASRDLTVAIAHAASFLGAVCPWIAGSDALRSRVSDIILRRGSLAWGLTERGRGSDLAATQTRLVDTPRDRELVGEKWLVNTATRGQAMTVLARTPEGATDLVFVEKDRAGNGRTEHLPKAWTHGIRGADISGIRFHNVSIGHSDRVGAPEHGLDLVLKGLQLTRTLCSALSAGAADHALEIVLAYSTAYPPRGSADASLASITAKAWLADLLAFVGARYIHFAPDELAFVSAAIKFVAPDVVDGLFDESARLMGEAAFTIDGPWGAFQKAERDHRVVSIFDGNSVVALNTVIGEFPRIRRSLASSDTQVTMFDLAQQTPPWELDRLQLISRSGCTLLARFPRLLEMMLSAHATPRREQIGNTLRSAWQETVVHLGTTVPTRQRTPSQFHVAERLSRLFAAGAAMQTFIDNPAKTTGPWTDGLWLDAVLWETARTLAPGATAPPGLADDIVAAVSQSSQPAALASLFA